MNKKINGLFLFVISLSLPLITGFTNISSTPKTVYRVYLKGEAIGAIKSKKSIENYIDKKQEEIKGKLKKTIILK